MKKIISILIAVTLIGTLTACGSSSSGNADSESQMAEENAVEEESASEQSNVGEGDTNSEDTIEATGSILVAYFSLAGEQYEVGEITKGNTQVIAEMIAEETGADLFSIDPVKEYSNDYNGKLDEATEEQQNNERPEIASVVENFDDYDTIFIGYPIWWGDMPNIVYTFLESYDFTGKTVIPFNTHAGSGQAGTQSTIASMLNSATVLDGIAVRGKTAQEDPDATRADVTGWLRQLGY
ncbi:MAG: flavodoxin [Eubacteriales bacterium]|nr:flavodoxin [Eubacteriales bacterium]